MKKSIIFILSFFILNICLGQEVVDEPVKPNDIIFLNAIRSEKLVEAIKKEALDCGYHLEGPNVFKSLFKNIKNADELSLFLGQHFTNESINDINSRFNTKLPYSNGQYDDCILLTSESFFTRKRKGYIGCTYRTTKFRGGIDDNNSIRESEELFKKYKRVIIFDKSSISDKFAKTLNKNGITFVQTYESLVNTANKTILPAEVVVYSSKNPKIASVIFEGQDGVEIAKITKECSKYRNFKIVDNITHLKQTLSLIKDKRIFVVHHNSLNDKENINQVVLDYNALSITCKNFENGKGDFLSIKDLDFETIIKAFEKTDLSPNTFEKTMGSFSKQYNSELNKKNKKINVVIIAWGSSLIGSIITALHFLLSADLLLESKRVNVT